MRIWGNETLFVNSEKMKTERIREERVGKRFRGNGKRAENAIPVQTHGQKPPGPKVKAKAVQKRKKADAEALATTNSAPTGGTKGGGKKGEGKSRASSSEPKQYTPELLAQMEDRACWMNQTKLNRGWTCGYRPVESHFSHKKTMTQAEFDNCRVPAPASKILAKGGLPQDFRQRNIDREKLSREGGGGKGEKGGK